MKTLLIITILSIVLITSYAQNNIGINNPTPDPSAALDIAATDMGLLIPRMTTSERINIIAPANGLLVFDTDTRSFWYYDANTTIWKNISNSGSSSLISDSDGDTYVTVEENPDDDTARIYIAGTEKFRFGPKGIEVVNTGNSIYIGEGAGKNDDISGLKNVAIGTAALENSTGRSGLVAIGDSALFNNSVGASVAWHSTDNTAIGAKALQSNTIGDKNTATGANSLSSNTIGYYNTANGFNALASNITGAWNTAIGFQSGFLNTTGCNNTGCGNQSLYNNNGNRNCAYGDNSMLYNSVGSDNTAVGYHTLQFNTTGNYNTAIGSSSNEKNISGHSNVAVGVSTLYHNQTQSNLVAVGDSALFNNGTGAIFPNDGCFNTAIGSKALFSNTIGERNTACGFWSQRANTTGDYNTAIGSFSLFVNTSGSSNTACGYESLSHNTTGICNTSIGFWALERNISGNYNSAAGHRSLEFNKTGSYNIALGTYSLNRNTDRSYLLAIGDSALFYNGTGATQSFHATQNIGIGSKTMFSNTTGYKNTALGYNSMFSNTTGMRNFAGGVFSLYSNINGNNNTAIGNEALYTTTEGNRNTAVGSKALISSSGGNENTAIGFKSLQNNITGDYNTAVGSQAGTGTGFTDLSNTGAYGYEASVTANNQIRIGNSSITSIGGFADWTNVSDKRFKSNIQENVSGLDFILKLRPVTYNLNVEKINDFLGVPDSSRSNEILRNATLEKEAIIQTGFIAQEVEEAAQSLGYDFSGVDAPKNEHDFYGLRYAEFVVPLVKAVQEQQEMIDKQNSTIVGLLKQNKVLLERIQRLEKKKN